MIHYSVNHSKKEFARGGCKYEYYRGVLGPAEAFGRGDLPLDFSAASADLVDEFAFRYSHRSEVVYPIL
jgi:hypothetical protein